MGDRTTRTLRRGRDRKLAGVCCGLAEAGGVDARLVRVGFIMLTVAGGVGIPIYIVLAIALPDADADPDADLRWGLSAADLRQPVGVSLVLGGTLLLLRNLGTPIPLGAVWGVSLGLGGASLGLRKVRGLDDRDDGSGLAALVSGRESAVRLLFGIALVGAGLATLVATGDGFGVLRQVLLGALVTVGGIGLILYPWMRGVLGDLREERRQRIRSEERADMAAHLHDSVLQTLALVQRNADRPREVVALARRQERELRSWLYNDSPAVVAATTLAAAITAMADEVEATHGIAVDVVNVGDCAFDERIDALAHAVREAMVNAAKHAGVDDVRVYVEVERGQASVFVRDRGQGFDRAGVPDDRKGISQSIEHRMARHGGTASVTSEPGSGTEVALVMPIDVKVTS
ncbi:MAG: PspC domain-containing protein [Acidimicrobiales bacterium]